MKYIQFSALYIDLDKINMPYIIFSGKVIQADGLDISAPSAANPTLQANRTSATLNWSTNELARGQVYYDTAPIQSSEASGHAQQAYVSGTSAPNNTDVRNSQSVTIQGLQPNTTYYYLTRAIDNSGNVSMTNANSFVTTQ